MGQTVLSCTSLAMATNPAPSSLLSITTATSPTNRTCQQPCQHNLLAKIKTCLGTVPTISAKHNAGHIHCALPICGLLPEGQHDTNNAAHKHNDHIYASNGIMKELLISKGSDIEQYTCKTGNQRSLAQSPVLGQTLSLIN